ncbi:MAG: 50S ribosomal protein L21 [Candidatus Dojkabacteria bacterium]
MTEPKKVIKKVVKKTVKKAVKKAVTKVVEKEVQVTSEKFAVIKISGVQLKVFEGKEYEVNKLEGNKGDALDIKDVLLVVDGEDIKIGKPLVEGSTVKLEITSQFKGEKINGLTFKAKSRNRRRYGYRASLTKVLVKKIS